VVRCPSCAIRVRDVSGNRDRYMVDEQRDGLLGPCSQGRSRARQAWMWLSALEQSTRTAHRWRPTTTCGIAAQYLAAASDQSTFADQACGDPLGAAARL
jgi:hypothetical protein